MGLLQTELTTDPLARGYAGMTDAQAAASLNTVNRTLPRTTIGGNDLLAATTVAELGVLSAASRDVYLAMIQMDSLDITSANIRDATRHAVRSRHHDARQSGCVGRQHACRSAARRSWAWARSRRGRSGAPAREWNDMTQTMTYSTPTAIANGLTTELDGLANGAYSRPRPRLTTRPPSTFTWRCNCGSPA